VATELPKTINVVIWMRLGKEMLALANISGSTMIQAAALSRFGPFFLLAGARKGQESGMVEFYTC
jgi:cation:H+ antiporter